MRTLCLDGTQKSDTHDLYFGVFYAVKSLNTLDTRPFQVIFGNIAIVRRIKRFRRGSCLLEDQKMSYG